MRPACILLSTAILVMTPPPGIAQESGDGSLDEAVTGAVPRRTIAAEEDPYAPLGVRVGGYVLYPSLTGTVGYVGNTAGVGGGTASGYAAVGSRFEIRSDWAEHEATMTLDSALRRYFDGTTADDPTLALDATGRLDLDDGWSAGFRGGYAYQTQAISDPDFPAGVDRPPGVHALSASASLTGGNGPATAILEGSLLRTIYEDGSSGGIAVDQGDRTNTVVAARLRLGYEAGAALTPFVAGEVSRRQYDQTVDNDGLLRSGYGYAARAGITVDRGPILTGEAAVGYARATFDDPVLASLASFIADGSLTWSPSVLTTVSLNGATTINPSADPASSGSVVFDASVEAEYAWRRNVTFEASAGVRRERFQGTGQIDTGYEAGLSATWKANRWVYLTGAYARGWLVSTEAGRGYRSDSVRVELTAQR